MFLQSDETNVKGWLPCEDGFGLSFFTESFKFRNDVAFQDLCPLFLPKPPGTEGTPEHLRKDARLNMEDVKTEVLETCEAEVMRVEKEANSLLPRDDDKTKEFKPVQSNEGNLIFIYISPVVESYYFFRRILHFNPRP